MALFGSTKTTPLTICVYGHPVLNRDSDDIDAATPEISELAERMVVTMRENDGIGLAAPQVGYNLNLVTLEVPMPSAEEPRPTSPGEMNLLSRMPVIMVNPVLSEFSEQTVVSAEGCLSLPEIEGDVERPEFVRLRFQDLDGQAFDFRCGGLLGRCVQHEIDHLRGHLFVERIPAEQLEAAQPQLQVLKRISQKQLRQERKKKG